jgi:hypothetical protein
MEHIGYSLIDAEGAEIQSWGNLSGQTAGIPAMIALPNGDHVHCPSVGETYSGLRLLPRMLEYGQQGAGVVGNNFVVTRSPPEPAQQPPRLIGSLNVTVSGGDVVAVEGAFNLLGALYLGVGEYMALFSAAEPDTEYFAQPIGGAPCMEIAEKGTDYLIVRALDAVGGNPVDPSQFAVFVYRG